jgi:hypothetical protein
MKYLSKRLWLAVCMSVVGALGWGIPITAQSATVISLNESFSGTMPGDGSLTFTIEGNLPLDQDIVVRYQADGFVMSGHSVVTEIFPVTTTQTVTAAGGGGGDGPVTGMFVIPAYSRTVPGTSLDGTVFRTGEISLFRPQSGDVPFTLTAYAVAPVYLDVSLFEPQSVEVTPDSPVQVFHMDADITIPFGLEITDANGVSTHVDSTPGSPAQSGLNAFRYVDLFEGQFIGSYPQWHQGDPELQGVTLASLYYYGGMTFRLIVVADSPYTLNTIPPTPAS